MSVQLRIEIVDPDLDYLGIEVTARNDRFAGSARIYAQLDDLNNLAATLKAFPSNPGDQRTYTIGTTDEGCAGGYCNLRFYCKDGAGHIAINVIFSDDFRLYSRGKAEFTLESIEASHIDSFVDQLQGISRTDFGFAAIEAQ